MFEKMKLKNFSKKRGELVDKQKKLQVEYEEKMDISKCSLCACYNKEAVRYYKDKFIKCESCDKMSGMKKLADKLDEIEDTITNYTRNEYAKAVFECYCEKKPDLISKNGEKLQWSEVFPKDFSTVSDEKKDALVGLVENYGAYKLA